MKKYLLMLAALLVAGGGFGAWYLRAGASHKTAYRTAKAARGDLVATINATGTIEPQEVVDIGAQVAGIINAFGTDPRNSNLPIDWGSPVHKGTVLAKIDDSLYKAAVDQAQANLGQAKAGVDQAQAKLDSAKADLVLAQANAKLAKATLEMDQKGGRSITDLQLEQDKATLATSLATVESSQAAIPGAAAALVQAQKAVDTAQANLNQAQINLGYCTITSPVEGVIIDRRVNIGQTVVSSLSAPSLFLIAQDLHRLQVWASVNEADIGNIQSGQPVQFTVDAYPNQTFTGVVAPDQPRLNATMTQNVVTYTVVVNTDNPNLKLKPYMTANLEFEVTRHSNVLKVPNAALRWTPQPQQVAPEFRAKFVQAQRRRAGASGSDNAQSADQGDQAAAAKQAKAHPQNHGQVWVQDATGFLKPVKVTVGLSDGADTEIMGGDLQENTDVVIGEDHSAGAGTADTTNPFTPHLFSGKKS